MAVLAPAQHRFTVEEWDRLGQLGFFGEDDRVELVDGEIVDMTPIGDRHAACVIRLTRLFSAQVGDDALVSVQGPVRLSEHSEPQPDLALLRFRDDDYASAKPTSSDVLLVVEVADTSLRYDRDRKASLYGRSGIPECWVVDLTSDQVLVFTQPSPDGYQTSVVSRPGEMLVPQLLPAVTMATSAVLVSG